MSFSIISGQCYGYPLVPYRDTNIPWDLGCCFEVLSFAAYSGYPLVPYRDTNIPCYLGCCFEVLSFAAYPGYPLVPYRDTNIPCDLGRCFDGTIFHSVPWVVSEIRANTVPPSDHTCHSSYSRYFVPWTGIPANKMASCDCLKVALRD